jgi:hypothetical protein
MDMETASKVGELQTSPYSLIYDRNDKPFGKTWEEWTEGWWQWVLSIPKDKNPGFDKTGKIFVLDKTDSDVIFLIGNYGGRSERQYVIPAGKALLFPVINFETSFTEEPCLKTDADLKSRAKRDIDDISRKEVEIDGISLNSMDNYRVQSDVFEINYPENNVFDLKPGPTYGISDGYWVFLKPLTVGEHLIHSVGACSLGKTMIECTWRITVV